MKVQQEAICKALTHENFWLLNRGSVTIGHVGIAGTKSFGGGFDRYMMPMYGEQMNKQFVQEAVDKSLDYLIVC